MGSKRGPFTDADLYVTANYVAAFSAFDIASAKERWQPFSERVSILSFDNVDFYVLHPVPPEISQILGRVLPSI